MDKFFKVVITTPKRTKEIFCDHVYDVEQLIEALCPGEFVSVTPLCIFDVTKDNADSIVHDVKD